MENSRGKYNRRSIRLKGYDYASPGEYFVTVCAHSHQCLFGEVVDGRMRLNAAGRMVDKWWHKIPEKFPNALLDVYQIMPNHFHAIVGITGPNAETDPANHSPNDDNIGVDPHINPGLRSSNPKNIGADPNINFDNVGADPRVCPEEDGGPVPGGHVGPGGHMGRGGHTGPPLPDYETRPASISGIVQWFKTMTTNEYIRGVKVGQFPPFDRKLWQRNYYEHIIRNERSLQRIRDYIINNPARWEQDRNHPDNLN